MDAAQASASSGKTPITSASPNRTASSPASWSRSASTRRTTAPTSSGSASAMRQFLYIDRIVIARARARRRRRPRVLRRRAELRRSALCRSLCCEVFLEARQRPRPALPRQLRLPRSRPAGDGRHRPARRMLVKELCSYPFVCRHLRQRSLPDQPWLAARMLPGRTPQPWRPAPERWRPPPDDYEQAGELKFGQVGIANLRIRTLDPARLADRDAPTACSARPSCSRAPPWCSISAA